MRKRKKEYGNTLHARSKITNGHALLPSIDHRSAWARRFKDLYASFLADLGDEDALSEGQRAEAKYAAVICTELDFLAVKFQQNNGADLDQLNVFQRSYNTLRRGIESLGTHRGRIAKDVTPTFGQLLRQDAIEQQLSDAAANAESRRAFEAKREAAE